MFTKLRQWFQKLWQWLRELLGTETTLPPKQYFPTDTDYEMEFMTFLEGIYQGKMQLLQQWESLQQKYSEGEWVAWLERWGQKLLASSEPNGELGQRLIRFGEIGAGKSGEVAAKLGQQLLSQVPSITEADLEDWLEQGRSLIDSQDQEALALFDQILAHDPNHDRAWINRGNVLSNLGRYEESIAAYDHALALHPKADLAWANRGNSLFDLEQYEAAIASWDRALELNPKDAETWHNKGMALGVKLNRWQEAIACFDRTLALEPDDIQTWFNRGIGWAALNQWEEALASWNQVTDRQPDFKDAWINKGVALQRLGRYAEAIAMNQQAMNPSSRLGERG